LPAARLGRWGSSLKEAARLLFRAAEVTSGERSIRAPRDANRPFADAQSEVHTGPDERTFMRREDEMNASAVGLRVLITAGAAGIGKAMANAFEDGGARVFVCDIDEAALASMRQARPSIASCHTDVADPRSVESMFNKAVVDLGGLDVLINNAGIAGPTSKVEEISIEDWDRTVSVDLSSMFYCIRCAVPLLKQAGGGSIINLSSIAGRLAYPLRSPYAAAKWGVIGLTKSLAAELGPSNIRVNAILPGVVEGDRVNRVVEARAVARGISFDDAMKQFVAPVSLRRMVKAEDIANMALFLATAPGANISGQALSVCGDHGYLA
jgi:NAD(P)-dependent dehydrogenase (short-subunit alcohol dehydrogenase family)